MTVHGSDHVTVKEPINAQLVDWVLASKQSPITDNLMSTCYAMPHDVIGETLWRRFKSRDLNKSRTQ